MYEAIASFINAVIAALQGIAKLGGIASNPVGAILGTNNASSTTGQENETGSKALPIESGETKTAQSVQTGKRALITIPETVNNHFDSRGSPAWVNQQGPLGKGYHYGTDMGAPNGSAVYAPYSGTVIKTGHYDDDGRRGDYIMLTLADGTEYYSGHLANLRHKTGDFVAAGTQLGEIGFYNHTHIQLRIGGVLSDWEKYASTH